MERGLDEVRREVIEARNLVIKTDNLLKNLHAELKAVGKRQEDFQKRQWISSAAAYVLFTAMVVVGASLISSSRMATATQEVAALKQSQGEISKQLEKQKADTEASNKVVKSANEVYRMMTSLPGDERLKGIDALIKLDKARLSPLESQALNDRAELLRKEVGQNAFERGKAAFHRNEMTVATEDFSRFLAMNPPEHDALEASFMLGTAYNQLKKHDKAAPPLARFINENKVGKNRDYAMTMLAQSYEATGQYEKAAEVAREGLGTYPNSQFASMLKARLSTAKRALSAAAPGAAQPGGAMAPPLPAPVKSTPAPVPAATAKPSH